MKAKTPQLKGVEIPSTDRVVNALLITEDGSYVSSQCWNGSEEAKEFARKHIANGSWDRAIVGVVLHPIEFATTYHYEGPEFIGLMPVTS